MVTVEPVVRVERAEDETLRVLSVRHGKIASEEYDFVVVALPNAGVPLIEWGGDALGDAMHRHCVRYDYPAHYLRVSVLFREIFWEQTFQDSYLMLDAFGSDAASDYIGGSLMVLMVLLGLLLRFVQETSLRFDGSAYRTMLRNDAYYFSRLGVYVERADNTARVLDVKYHVLLPEQEAVGGSVDYFQWTAILRSVSALTAYHWVFRESIKPWNVADLLILRPQMPRSLISCYDNIVRFLDAIGVPVVRATSSAAYRYGISL